MAQEGYLYLGALFTNTINWDAISADHTQKVWGAYMGLRHNSSIVRNLSMAQQLQLMKVFLAPYLQAFSPVRPTAPSLVLAARRRVEALSNVIRLPANASHLLLHTIGGAPTELAHRLRERLRLFLHFACHPSRKQDPTICVPTSVRLFSGLLQEATQCIANNIRPKAYNWVHESLLAFSPHRHLMGNEYPQWPFLIPHIIKNFEAGASYEQMREASIPKWGREDARACVFTEGFRPQLNGGLKHAGFITAWLTTPFQDFLGPDGPGFGTQGPGLRHPLALSSHGNCTYTALVRAQQGCAALRKWPWVLHTEDDGPPLDDDGNPTPDGVTGAVEDVPANWNDYTDCPLCGNHEDSVYHAACECPHPAMLSIRGAFRGSAMRHIQHICKGLVEARSRALDTPEAIPLSPLQDRALQCNGLTEPADPSAPPCTESEKRTYTYRLLIAAPWAERNADHSHVLAAAVGRHFDGVRARTVPNNLIRRTASAMCSWGDRWIVRIARARRKAIDARPPNPGQL